MRICNPEQCWDDGQRDGDDCYPVKFLQVYALTLLWPGYKLWLHWKSETLNKSSNLFKSQSTHICIKDNTFCFVYLTEFYEAKM